MRPEDPDGEPAFAWDEGPGARGSGPALGAEVPLRRFPRPCTAQASGAEVADGLGGEVRDSGWWLNHAPTYLTGVTLPSSAVVPGTTAACLGRTDHLSVKTRCLVNNPASHLLSVSGVVCRSLTHIARLGPAAPPSGLLSPGTWVFLPLGARATRCCPVAWPGLALRLQPSFFFGVWALVLPV